MSLEMQAKFLRVLEERVVTPMGATRGEPVDLRIVAATHLDLPKLEEEGSSGRSSTSGSMCCQST